MVNHSVNRFIALVALISFCFTVSCTTSKVHPLHTTLPQQKVEGIKVGDTVKITTYSGEQYKFKVENITKEEIEGEGITVALTDIESIKKVYITGRTVAIALGIIALLALFVFLGSNSEYQGNRRYSGEAAR